MSSNSGVNQIPASLKKTIQSLKEIVNCSESEIYAMLKECNMDPDEAVNRLLSQDPFHEVKSKREKKKENKNVIDSRYRGTSSTSTQSSRGGPDWFSSRICTSQYGVSDSGTSREKPTYKKENGPSAYASSAMGTTGNIVNRRQPGVRDATTHKGLSFNAVESISVAPPSSGFQSAWSGMADQKSMADIVKMGRPHGKVSSSLNTSQQHVNQNFMGSPAVYAPHVDYQRNEAANVPEVNPESGVARSHGVTHNDDWPLEEEPAAASVSIVEQSVDSEPYGDPYDRIKQKFGCQSDEVRCDNSHANFVRSVPQSDQNMQDNSGAASGFDKEMYQNISSYQIHHQEVADASVSVSSVTANFQSLSLPIEDEDSPSEEDVPTVKIPDHLQVKSAECSHFSFGSFRSGLSSPFPASFPSIAVKSNEEAALSIEQSEARNPEYYEDQHLRTISDRNIVHGMDASSSDFDAPSVSQPYLLKQKAPEAAEENQQSFRSSTPNYAFENSQQLNSSFANSQAITQMQGLPPLSGLMPYSNTLPSRLFTANMQSLREAELAYSPFSVSQSMASKNSNSISSISGPTISMAEALKAGNFSATQPPQNLPGGGNISGGAAVPQHLAVTPYSQPSVARGQFAANMMGYPFLPQSYTYMPSAFQQAFAGGNSSYPQSLAAPMLPQHKHSVSVSSLPQSAAVASGYGAFGNSNSIPSNLPLNPPNAPAGTSINYDDVLSSQYNDSSHLFSLQQGPGSRTLSGVPGSTYYSFQGQNQHPTGLRQTQQPSQQHGPHSGYPNFYHSQVRLSLEPQHQHQQMLRDVALSSSPSQQQKQIPHHMWHNSY